MNIALFKMKKIDISELRKSHEQEAETEEKQP
jgi:hypothetical protein